MGYSVCAFVHHIMQFYRLILLVGELVLASAGIFDFCIPLRHHVIVCFTGASLLGHGASRAFVTQLFLFGACRDGLCLCAGSLDFPHVLAA